MIGRRTAAVVLMAAALVLATMGAVSADLEPTNVIQAWDDTAQKYENGNMVMWLNSEPETFYTKLDFDTDGHADACGAGSALTPWAGDAHIDLYHTDNDPMGAEGFQSTSNWKLVPCSDFGPDPNDTVKYPTTTLASCVISDSLAGQACVLMGQPDVVTSCSTGNCLDEIVTNFHINTDLDCDGTMDPAFAAYWSSNPQENNLCLYWEAEKPANAAPYWQGNFQVRYGAGQGGDKTLNFSDRFLGPNAVTMSSLAAVAEGNSASLAMWAGAMGLAALALWLWRRQTEM